MLPVVLLLAACAAPVPSLPPSARPTTSSTPTVNLIQTVTPGIINLHMFTPAVGWAQRQSDGAILHTTNGVLRWGVAAPGIGTEQIIAVAFVDADAARLLAAVVPSPDNAGAKAVITSWASDDGGTHWTRRGSMTDIALLGQPPGSLDFVDRQHGWYSITGLGAAGSSAIFIYRTSDGGAEWFEVDSTYVSPTPGQSKVPAGCDKNPASFINATTGWVTARCNGGPYFMDVTHDGGLSWRNQALAFPASQYGSQTSPPQFTTSKDGCMLADAGTPGANSLLYVTTDGGSTWSSNATPGPSPQTLDFLDAHNGWVAGSPNSAVAPESALWVTHNAGRTWTNAAPNLNLDGASLDFVTTQLGWAFDPFPTPSSPPAKLLQTTDGGHVWVVLNPAIAAT